MTPPIPRSRILRRVLRRACPQCGEGRLFARYARLNHACGSCGLVYRRESGAQTGSMYLTAAVTEVFAALVVAVIWILADWSVALSVGVSLPLVGLFCYGFLPVSQALWVGVEYATDVHNGEEWVRPRP